MWRKCQRWQSTVAAQWESGLYRSRERGWDCKTNFTRALGTIETEYWSEKAQRHKYLETSAQCTERQGICQQSAAWCQLKMQIGGWWGRLSLGFYFQMSSAVTTTCLPCHAGILNSSNIMTVIAPATEEGSTTMIRKSLMASLCKSKGLAQRPLTKMKG